MKKHIHVINFLDHCQVTGGMTEPIKCTVVGFLVTQDAKAYYVASWIAGDEVDHNSDTYAILKSTVTKIRKVRI
jgi:hypothetical protein